MTTTRNMQTWPGCSRQHSGTLQRGTRQPRRELGGRGEQGGGGATERGMDS